MDELKAYPDISKMVESAEIKLCNLADEWKETLKCQYDYAAYDKNTGLWKYGDPTRVECARYSLLAYQNAAKIVADLGQAIDNMSRTQPKNKPLIISLPCKVGSIVYVIAICEEIMMYQDNDYLNGTGEVTCPFESNCDYEECNDQNVQIFETVVLSFMVEEDYIAFWTEHLAPEYRMDDLGRTVFLTRDAAEKKLKEDNNEKAL